MTAPRILFDGWDLAHDPLSPAALHLLDILEQFPPGPEAHLAWPGAPPDWLPSFLNLHPSPAADRLRWEQRGLPQLAARLGAQLHLTAPAAPLWYAGRVLVSPSGAAAPDGVSFRERLRLSLGRGGAARARLLWPEDVPLPLESADALRAAPAVSPRFRPLERFLPPEIPGCPDLPETFFLVHLPPDRAALRRALEAWTWAAGPIGDVYPLLFLAMPEAMQKFIRDMAEDLHLRETFIFYPAVRPGDLHLLFQTAAAVFHPAPIGPWSSPVRLGIACAKPVVALETAVSSAVAGPAAYLVPPDDPRRLGAALISVIVREDTRKQLVDAAQQRRKTWQGERFQAGLEAAYAG